MSRTTPRRALRHVLSAIAAVLMVMATGQCVGAQIPIPPDTTIQPGHLDFSRYTKPSACILAALTEAAVAERAQIDTAAYAPEHDPLPARAVSVAQRCRARFDAATVSPRELLSMVQLALAARQPDVARVAADRWVGLLRDPNAKGWALYSVVQAFLRARPMLRDDADRLTARMDALGAAAAAPTGNAHNLLLLDALQRFDNARTRHEAMAILAMNHEIVGEETNDLEYGAGNAVLALLRAETYDSLETAVPNVLRAARHVGYQIDSASAVGILKGVLTPLGLTTPALPAEHWYGPHTGTSWPVAGTVSLLFEMPTDVRDYGTFAIIRRLHKRFGASLNITIVTATHGYFAGSAPLTPAAEADSIRRYLQEEQRLPVTVAVEETPFRHAPDGRRVDQPVTITSGGIYGLGIVLVDGTNHIVTASEGTESLLVAYVARTIDRMRASAGP